MKIDGQRDRLLPLFENLNMNPRWNRLTGWYRCRQRCAELVLPSLCPVCLAVRLDPTEAESICAECRSKLRELPEPRCRGCGGALDGILNCCGECLARGVRPWDDAVTAFDFRGEIREIIHRFKYQGQTFLAPFLAERLHRNWERFGSGKPDMIVPLPLHWWRELHRGFNQAELLAECLARRLDVPLSRCVQRRQWTRQQAHLNFDERRRNMATAFRLRTAPASGIRHVLMVDDVLTTGATLGSAALTLRKAGIDRISVITVARG